MGIRNTPRTIARDNGEKTYEGKPCKNPEHVNENGTTTRLVSFNGCQKCNLARATRWNRQRREYIEAYNALIAGKI